ELAQAARPGRLPLVDEREIDFRTKMVGARALQPLALAALTHLAADRVEGCCAPAGRGELVGGIKGTEGDVVFAVAADPDHLLYRMHLIIERCRPVGYHALLDIPGGDMQPVAALLEEIDRR